LDLEEHGIAMTCPTLPRDFRKVTFFNTRMDRERLISKKVKLEQYNVGPNYLKKLKKDAVIMHPLPRSIEISPEVDLDPRAAYFRQAQNGLFVRMALLTMIFDEQ